MKRLLGFLTLGVALLGSASPAQAKAGRPGAAAATLARVPVHFVENGGVYPDEVAFYVHGSRKSLFFTKSGITIRLAGDEGAWVVKLTFVGARHDVALRGEDRRRAKVSYFRGTKSEWKTGIRTYSQIVYPDLWPGIDLVYAGGVNELKYHFVVRPGADPACIRIRYEGIDGLAITETGALRVETPRGSFNDAAPVSYQEIGGDRAEVATTFELAPGDGLPDEVHGFDFGFELGAYDRSKTLTVDPAVLLYCGYLGGLANDVCQGVAADATGAVYVVGTTDFGKRLAFPVRTGPDLTHNGSTDVFVAKVAPSGTSLVYCGYIGGSSGEWCAGVAVDAQGAAYVVGTTSSTQGSFPVSGGPDLTHNLLQDVFVAKVSPSGTSLAYCGYIGGSAVEWATGIAVDSLGCAYVSGITYSTQASFPVKFGPDFSHNGSTDAFVAKVAANGKSLVYCGYIGSQQVDTCGGVAVDALGCAYVTGSVYGPGTGFPVKGGPDLTHNGFKEDAFIAKVSASGAGLVYCGYIGGAHMDWGQDVAVDAKGCAFVAGETYSSATTFPVKGGPDLTYNGLNDIFVAKVAANGSSLVYCGYIGGSGNEAIPAIAVDGQGCAHVVGPTNSTEKTFPVTWGLDRTFNLGPFDAFLAVVEPSGAALRMCGYIGGRGDDLGVGVALDGAGSTYVAGTTEGSESAFPRVVGPDLTYNGFIDTFVAKVGFAFVVAGGTPRPGGSVTFTIQAPGDRGSTYQVGSSLGTGPILVGRRRIHLAADGLLTVSVQGAWPSVFSGYAGVIDANDRATANLTIPGVPALIGLSIHTACVTLDPKAPAGIRSISNTASFTVTK